ncbi:ferrochelatase [Xenorhabdus bovienii]|uniref:Ferrochelatase n=2 Tax=Xenorhabdus bovienii TaxID=40576 RepID=A0A0B6X6G2_XENBV|nr:ferrochelatase [Xenorhabdus bovienii]CDG89820.1 ferrochelatase [Xenorhabdus bovienii str. feltiae France]CDG90783.1 ferrochelatase [Xenorhabdus bovienii str. feltiae Florida]CDH22869.1 ferrochelatase [Xenorhabdus bovienii str. kraussei Becker Underwood]CDM88263.1 Ferrochelatase [Xenorhabdus bovienii]
MSSNKYGVLLVNLGTPDEPTPVAIRRYLAKFLSDRRVVDIPPFIWKPLLYGIILPFRSSRVAKLYQGIWTEEGSPLLVYSQRQQTLLNERLTDIPVVLGMSYGFPSLPQAVGSLLQQGIDHLIVLPLYPQYSSTTSAAVFDSISKILKGYRTIPHLHFIRSYATHPAYIAALKATIEQSFEKHGLPDRLLLSYHGIPERLATIGDIYPQDCRATTELLIQALDYPADKIMMTFQSRFGRLPWLTPYTDKTMALLPEQGVEHVQVLCPGFSSDCLETLEEIQQQNQAIFLHAGGKKFEYISALNDNEAHISLLEQLVNNAMK